MDQSKTYPYLVLGGGLSGLSTAYYLKQKNVDFLLLEKENRTGGVIESFKLEDCLFDRAAISFLLSPEIDEMINKLGLKDELLLPKLASKTRYIYANGRLNKLKSPLSILTSSLLSWKAKWRLFKENKIKSISPSGESVADFISRRFGREAYEKVGNAIMGGIYAGDPEKMEAASVLKRFVEIERKYSSLLKGMRKEASGQKRISVSFKQGSDQLIKSLHEYNKDRIMLGSKITSIYKQKDYWEVLCNDQVFKAEKIISCLPSFALASIIPSGFGIGQELREIPYCKVSLLHLVYDRKSVKNAIDGFGFLVPKIENKPILGAVMNSSVFDGRSKEDQIAISVFVGEENTKDHSEKAYDEAIAFLSESLGITSSPIKKEVSYWEQAIPQFHIGHREKMNKIRTATEPEGLIVSGNFMSKPSVGDIVKYASEIL